MAAMKAIISFVMVSLACGVCWGQAGFSGSASLSSGITITFHSKLEPPGPELGGAGASGVRGLGNRSSEGMCRYSTNAKTHEYFGYDMRVQPIDESAGTYRVTFSELTLTPEKLHLPDPQSWHMLPAPVFPPPETVTTADTIALDLFVNPATGQKIVDYIRLKRDGCNAENAGPGQVACLNGLVRDEQGRLEEKLTQMENTRDGAAAASLKESQLAWEKYRDAACANVANEAERLQCQLKLTRSRIRDLGTIY